MQRSKFAKTLIKRRLNGLCAQFERHTGRFCCHRPICVPILGTVSVKMTGWRDKRGDNRSDDEKRNVLRGVTRGVTLLTFNGGLFLGVNTEKRVFLGAKMCYRGGLIPYFTGLFWTNKSVQMPCLSGFCVYLQCKTTKKVCVCVLIIVLPTSRWSF